MPGSILNRLPRSMAGELQLLAGLVPVIVTNLSSDPFQEVHSSDASTGKGAFCIAPVDPALGLQAWLASDFKGSSVLLDKTSSPHPPLKLGDEADREDDP